MAKRKFEEILEDLKDEVSEDLYEELQEYKGSKLREKAESLTSVEAERDALKAKVEQLEAAPARRKAFEDYGIDLENLSKAEAAILEGYEGELDAEALGKLAEEYELPVVQGADQEEGEERPAAEAQTRQATSTTQRAARLTITPEQFSELEMDKRMNFMKEHPKEHEALMRGETVTGVPV
jgi:hypothetical protein